MSKWVIGFNTCLPVRWLLLIPINHRSIEYRSWPAAVIDRLWRRSDFLLSKSIWAQHQPYPQPAVPLFAFIIKSKWLRGSPDDGATLLLLLSAIISVPSFGHSLHQTCCLVRWWPIVHIQSIYPYTYTDIVIMYYEKNPRRETSIGPPNPMAERHQETLDPEISQSPQQQQPPQSVEGL